MVGSVWLLLGCVSAPPAVFVPTASVMKPSSWPASGDGLSPLPTRDCLPPVETVFIQAGHANGRGRDGNLGVHGQIEAEVNLETADRLAAALESTGCFRVVRGRVGDQRPSYGARIRHAQRVGADAFIELHTDARGAFEPWAYTRTDWVYEAPGSTGFSVLYNESGPIAEGRRALARDVTRSLRKAHFEPYPDYGQLYQADAELGAHIDRRGLKMLREPTMPSIIIETHNAKHFEESLRWREPRTHAVFASAIFDALVTHFEGPRAPMPCTAPPVER